LADAKNLYFIRVSEFVIMNTRIIKSPLLQKNRLSFCLYSRRFTGLKYGISHIITPEVKIE